MATLAMAAQAPAQTAAKGPQWLDKAVFYQIYPSSFKDSDGNGIGDLQGIISKLDYIQSLGVNALWLNPVFESGWIDGGYDVIDFYKIDPRFGTNTDMVRLTTEAHKRGIKVCLDLVAGHTSDRCEWFRQSGTADRNSRYSDYYIWLDSISPREQELIRQRHASAHPSSDGRGLYVESAYPRARYYMKNYYESQPALNYGYAHPDPRHPWEQAVTSPGPQAVRREMRNVMAFWFDKGIDGFRVDMASSLVKNDNDRSAILALWQEMRRWKDQHYPECVLISEWGNPMLSIPAGFNIDFLLHFNRPGYPSLFFDKGTPYGERSKFEYSYFNRTGKGQIAEFIDNFTPCYNRARSANAFIAIPTANHDFQRPNVGTRNTVDQLKVAMTFFLTMPGVPFIYYGDEIGMKYQMNLPNKEGSNERAGTRTPMQWNKSENAGFSTSSPEKLYLPVDTEKGKLTVEAQDHTKGSLLEYTRQLTKLRHSVKALDNDGDWKLLNGKDQSYPMVYERTAGAEKYVVVLNPSAKSVSINIATLGRKAEPVLASGKVEYKASKAHDTIKAAGVSAAIFKMAQ